MADRHSPAPTPVPKFDPQWREKYASRVVTPSEAAERIRPGQRVFIGTGCGQPQALVAAVSARWRDLADTEIVHLLTSGEAPYAQTEMISHFRVNSFFITENVRGVIQDGLGDYTPMFLSEIPRLFQSGQLPLDVALIQVSPPDDQGLCSLGVSVDIVMPAAQNAALVIAQVNPQMPRTGGDSFLHVHDLDVLVDADEPLCEIRSPEPDDDTRRIAEYVAALVCDGATLELGIGRIPQAVLEFLTDKKDLGIHTEMLTDPIVDLIEAGVVTGAHKTLDRGRVVASFCLGTRKLYDYIDDNPIFAFKPTDYVNDPFIIGRQHHMVAINVALEVDLTGQVCSDSLGNKFFSGIGGQVDFNRGAARSRGGKAIIAMPSTALGGTVSRIVGTLSPGAGVVTTRGDVHYVVTEHGVAYLHGKSVRERAMALISISHPDFRADLLREAERLRYVHMEVGVANVEGKLVVEPPGLRTTQLLGDGTQVSYRPIHPTDEPRMRDLFYALSEDAIYNRFMQTVKSVPRKQIQEFTFIDHRSEVAIVGTIPEAHGEEIIALGAYYLEPRTNRAEVAFVVRDEWQHRGIGTFLNRYLATIARRHGIRGFTAEVLRRNRGMQVVFQNCGLKVTSRVEDGIFHFEMDFE
jgi:acyl-CoA hydrolase/GNAT superfamily N-acetyltransferase